MLLKMSFRCEIMTEDKGVNLLELGQVAVEMFPPDKFPGAKIKNAGHDYLGRPFVAMGWESEEAVSSEENSGAA